MNLDEIKMRTLIMLCHVSLKHMEIVLTLLSELACLSFIPLLFFLSFFSFVSFGLSVSNFTILVTFYS